VITGDGENEVSGALFLRTLVVAGDFAEILLPLATNFSAFEKNERITLHIPCEAWATHVTFTNL
jgi:hypothetical protein